MTGNVTAGNVSATGIAGTLSTAAQTSITSVGTLSGLTVSATITGSVSGSAGTAGTVTTAAQGNITSVGTLTSLSVSGNVSSATAAVDTNTTQLATTAYVIAQASAATPTTIGTNTIGTSTRYARADHTHTGVSSAVASTGISVSGATGAVTFTNTGVTSAVAGTNISVSGATGAVTMAVTGTVPTATTAATVTTAAQGNITSVGTLTALTVSGALSSGAHTITGSPVTAIIQGGTTGTGNIGASGATFNTVFAKATTAQYADLAEKYTADADYAAGTVVMFGGANEVTLANQDSTTRIAGVISENPGFIMNEALQSEFVAVVALQGRVPCRVVGPVEKGDMMVATSNGAARADNSARAGTIIGKALENFDGAEGTIEVVVGRN